MVIFSIIALIIHITSSNIFTGYQTILFNSLTSLSMTSDGIYLGTSQNSPTRLITIFKNSGYGFQLYTQRSDNQYPSFYNKISNDGEKIVLVTRYQIFFYKNNGTTFQKIYYLFNGSFSNQIAVATDTLDYLLVYRNYQIKVIRENGGFWELIQSISISPANLTNKPISMAITSDHNYFIYSSDNSTFVYKFNGTNYQFYQTLVAGKSFNCLSISDSYPYTLVGGKDSSVSSHQVSIYLFNGTSFQLHQIMDTVNNVTAIAISSNGNNLFFGTIVGEVMEYFRSNNYFYFSIRKSTYSTNSTSYQVDYLAVSNFDQYVAIGYATDSVYIYFRCELPFCTKCVAYQTCSTCSGSSYLSNYRCLCDNKNTISNTTGSCVQCNLDNCSRCDSDNICAQCQLTYILVANTSCGCDTTKNLSLVNGYCVHCLISNCLSCNFNNLCSSCVTGYTVSNLSGYCVPCAITKCKRCDYNNTCAECIGMRTISLTTGLCAKCFQQHCQRCDQENICAVCYSGFTKILNKQCICESDKVILANGTQCEYVKQVNSIIGLIVLILSLTILSIILIYYIIKFVRGKKLDVKPLNQEQSQLITIKQQNNTKLN